MESPKRERRDPAEVKARKSALWKARNRAHLILATEFPERFMEIKNELLTKWGLDPIDPHQQRRHSATDYTVQNADDSDRSQSSK